VQTDLVVPSSVAASRHPANVVAVRTARKAVRSGVLWGYLFGIQVASASLGYASTYKTLAQRAHLAALFGSNGGLAAINGPAHDLQTVAGYTVWKSFMFLIILGAVWGLLIATKLLRGEEDAGRWELLLAGQTTRRQAAGQALIGLGAGLAALWAVTAVITVGVGRSSKVHIATGAALYFAVALVAGAALFLAVGALVSQLAATRRQAAGYAGTALGIFYAVRLIADSGRGLGWLRWATPLGWVEELEPLTHPRPIALVPILALVVMLVGLSVYLAGVRDLGTSVFPDRVSTRPDTRLLSGPIGLTVRLVRPTVLGWTAGIGALSFLMGYIAKQGGDVLTSSSSVARVIARLGGRGFGAVLYLGFTFLLVALMVALVAAGQVTAARSEEAEGRLDHLLVRPLSRSSWMTGRIAVILGIVVASGLLAGIVAWAGSATQQSGVGLRSLLGAGLNVIPPAVFIVGIGVFVMGVWPRATAVATYGVLTWSVLVEFAGGFISSNHWVLDTSVFHQMTSSPAVPPNWTSGLVLVGLGLAAALVGGIAFSRRDLASE
jgi:ABC-2 type transport system permease protein